MAPRSPMSESLVTEVRKDGGRKKAPGSSSLRDPTHCRGEAGGFPLRRYQRTATTRIAMKARMRPPNTRGLPAGVSRVPAGRTVMLPHIVARSPPATRSLRYRKIPVRFETVKFQRTAVPKLGDRGSPALTAELLL